MNVLKFISFSFIFIFVLGFVSAGVGISWDKESALVPEKTKTCLTYKVYNPWPEDSYVQIKLSDEMMEIISSAESETKFVPKETASSQAIPIEFCFKTPSIYEKDCLIGDSLICKKDCLEPLQTFSGEVQVVELSEEEAKLGGAQGSKTMMSVSAPIKVRVQCIPHKRDYSVVYLTVALIAGILLAISLIRGRRVARNISKKAKKIIEKKGKPVSKKGKSKKKK